MGIGRPYCWLHCQTGYTYHPSLHAVACRSDRNLPLSAAARPHAPRVALQLAVLNNCRIMRPSLPALLCASTSTASTVAATVPTPQAAAAVPVPLVMPFLYPTLALATMPAGCTLGAGPGLPPPAASCECVWWLAHVAENLPK